MPKPGPQLRRHDTRLAAVIEPAADGAEQSVGGKPWGGTRGDHSPDGPDRSPQRGGTSHHHNHNGERSVAAGEVSVGVEGAARAILANDMPALRSFIGLGGKPRIVTRRFLGPVPLPKPYDGSRILAERSSLPHLAARCGNDDALRLLVDAGYYIGQPDSNDDTALILALRHCPRALHHMITQGKERRLRDVHPRTGRAFIHELMATPQPSRAGFRRMPLLEFLVAEYGVNPREPDRDGLTPLDLAQAHYLQLGREADAIIAFLEDPPRARTSAQTALSRGVAGLARHPVARFVVLFLSVVVHTLMYMADTHDRGTERPFLCPDVPEPTTNADGDLVPFYSWAGTVFVGCPEIVAAQNGTTANQTSPVAQALSSVLGRRGLLQNTSTSARGGGFADVNDTAGLHFADVFVNRTVRGPAKGTRLQQRFVAYGFRDQRVSMPFAMDIVDHVVFDWEADTSIIAAKLLTILIGGTIGALVFGLVGHMILRDVFRLGIFGYDPWVDLTRPGSTAAENSKRDAEQGFFTNPATAPEPDAATDDGDFEGAAESALVPASDASPPERSFRYSPREVSNPLSQPTAFNGRAGDLPSHPTDGSAGGNSAVPASYKPGADALKRAGKQEEAKSYIHEVGGGLAAMLLGYHPSPAVTASVGRGRGVLLLYGFLTGIYCGGLVFNVLLDEAVVGGVDSDSALYMRAEVRHFDGEPVLRGELWYITMSLTLCLLPLIIVTAVDEMGQSLARQQFLPTAWFGRFGLETWQVAWPHVRVAGPVALLLVWWTAICLILLQDVRYMGWLFTFDDLPATLLAPPSPSVNIFIGGVALLLDVAVLMQSWGLPRLQALVTFTTPFVPKPTASARAPTRFAAAAAGGGGTSASAVDVDPDTGDDRVDVEIARRRRREELLQGVLTAPPAPGKRSVRLTGIEREEARHGTMAAANRGSGATHEIVSVTDAFKLPFTGIRGNIYWLLWTLIPWVAVLDAVYEYKYIVLVICNPDGMHTTSPIYPKLGHGTIFDRAGEDRGAGLDVLWFSLAMVPCVAAAVWLFVWALSNSGLFRSCFPAAYAIPPLPAVDERTLEVVCSTVPCDRAKLRIHQRFVNRGVTDLPRSRLDPVRDFHNGNRAADAEGDDFGDDPGTVGINGNAASVYDNGGRNAVVDPFACAYRDDVVRLGSLLDADPSVINERGGVGLRVARRPSASFGNDIGESSFMARVPGLLGADGADGPSFDALSPARDSPTLRPVSVPQQRVASLLSHGDPSMYAATPLHYAVLGNARSSVSALLSRGANPRIRTMSGLCTAEELAEMMHFEGLASLLRTSVSSSHQ